MSKKWYVVEVPWENGHDFEKGLVQTARDLYFDLATVDVGHFTLVYCKDEQTAQVFLTIVQSFCSEAHMDHPLRGYPSVHVPMPTIAITNHLKELNLIAGY